MPVTVSYPGVYIEEIPSGVRTITGVATSITAFLGRALRGPVDQPVRVQSYAEFERTFGVLWAESTLGYAVSHFFLNGGGDALIIRVHNGATASTVTIGGLGLIAASPGEWGGAMRVRIDHQTRPLLPSEGADTLFNLTIRDAGTGVTESFLNLSTESGHKRFATTVLEQESKLVRVNGAVPATRPTASGDPPAGTDPMTDDASSTAFGNDGSHGVAITDAEISAPTLEAPKRGIWALEKADLFNLLCVPPLTRAPAGNVGAQTRAAAVAYCKKRRAVFIVDPLNEWDEVSDLTGANGLDSATWGLARSENAALFFPRLRLPDPLQEGRLSEFSPCGAVAGIMARTDAARGVWKAPAGLEATINGVTELTVKLTDGENGQLNPLAVNCLRSFPVVGRVVWGSRTLLGADILASEWKYVPVRRLALFIEESLYRGTQWVVFEPNDEPLWAQIRLNLGAFMNGLFRQGAFQGRSPREAYFVKCDKETTTQDDINKGIVNIVVGFAPLKPAEFVIIKIQQMAGEILT
ncbi:MAG: phage tail sheath subtilisin-like domain-containing protein [Nitrospirales bacterium]|nr:phage tail sheath subtilisin-like domain-containing protein [Nitrospirales bacterium]